MNAPKMYANQTISVSTCWEVFAAKKLSAQEIMFWIQITRSIFFK